MNYIHQLQQQIAEEKKRVEELEATLADIAAYLALPKFETDTSVSKYDILRIIGRY